jgi:serine/threonine protein kinase
MEYAEGGPLVRHIYGGGGRGGDGLPEAEALRVFLQIASALDYCHKRWALVGGRVHARALSGWERPAWLGSSFRLAAAPCLEAMCP